MKKSIALSGFLMVMAANMGAAEAVPMSFTHHGLIREKGELVSGSRNITATLYDDGNNEIIGRKIETVLVEDGYYTMTIDGISEDKLRAASKVVLGLKMDSNAELEPRLAVNSVPYAVVAKYAERAGYVDCVGCISQDELDFDPTELVTNLPYAKSDEVGGAALAAKKLTCTNCVSNEQANFNYAGSNEKGGAALAVADGVVTAKSLATNAVVAEKISTGAVTSDKIASGAVVAGKLGTGAVTKANIASSAVAEEKIADLAVTTGKLAEKSVTAAKLASNAAIENLNNSGYYAPVAWAALNIISTVSSNTPRNNGGSLSVASDKKSMTFTLSKARQTTNYAIDLSFLPSYAVLQNEYSRIFVPKIINKTTKGFTIEIYRCVAEVDGTNEAYCEKSNAWYNEGTHVLVKIFD